MIDMNCPHCGVLLEADDSQAGKVGNCSNCQKLFTVPEAPPPPTATIAAEPQAQEPPEPAPPTNKNGHRKIVISKRGGRAVTNTRRSGTGGRRTTRAAPPQAERAGAGAVVAGYVCMGLVLAIGWIPVIGWAVGGILELAVFVLAIVGMAQGNIKGGVVLIVFAVITPIVLLALLAAVAVTIIPYPGI